MLFYAPTGYRLQHRRHPAGHQQRPGAGSLLRAAGRQPDDIDATDSYGTGSNVTESLHVRSEGRADRGEPGIYYVRVSSVRHQPLGPGSEYELKIYEPIGGSGGALLLANPGSGSSGTAISRVSIGPSNAVAAGAAWRVAELGGRLVQRYTSSTPCRCPRCRQTGTSPSGTSRASRLPPGRRSRCRPTGPSPSRPLPPVYAYTNLIPKTVGMSLGAGGVFGVHLPGHPGQVLRHRGEHQPGPLGAHRRPTRSPRTASCGSPSPTTPSNPAPSTGGI